MGQNRRCGFGRIPLRTVPRQEREPHVHIRETVALDQSANPGRRAVEQTGRVQAETMPPITVDGTLQHVFAGVAYGSYPFVADESQERGFVQQLQYEGVIVRIEITQR